MSAHTRKGNQKEDKHVIYNEARDEIENILANPIPVNWDVVHSLLRFLDPDLIDPFSLGNYTSTQDDPMGRLLLAGILSRNPPLHILQTALQVFPHSLKRNPAAFFVACQQACPSVIAQMTRHITRSSEDVDECPFPWVLSEHITIEGATAILETFPSGVLKKSSFLSSYSLLDFILMSPDMVEQRKFDAIFWKKFKLILIAAQCANSEAYLTGQCEIAPVQVILSRALSRADFFDSPKRAEHVLWLLHQLRSTDQWVFEKRSPDGRYPVHLLLSHKCTRGTQGLVVARALVELLLEANPASAAHWINGKPTLHMAIENGWPCHDLLLALYPDALDARDPDSELFPFQSAAKHHHATNSSLSLDITYELLRANPCHARSMRKEAQSIGSPA